MAETTASSDLPGDADEWLELETRVEPEAVESVSAVFAEYGQGVAIEQVVESSRDGDVVHLPSEAPVLVKTYLPRLDRMSGERRARIEHAVWALGKLRDVGPLQVRALRETDWANAWKEYFFVHRVGRRTVIVPSWRESEYASRPGDVVLLLDPGMAFGTGLHPTTRLCLQALEEVLEPGMRVLDVGAGSGILSIAAARLGAGSVEAVELEAVAARVCQQNVQRNELGTLVRVRAGTLQGPPDELVDLVLGNITIATLLELEPQLAQQLRSGGLAILSGVLAERADELLDALRAAGWQHERTDHEQDWVALLVRRP
ncbi:MAG: 50S ribosomal protein L11 methyltransferase [Chloroflexi bacterium]|nr:50S ribosomal protein L11 methyltransferase [Chloroflexota bacterium]